MKRWTGHDGRKRTYGWSGKIYRFGWRIMVYKHPSYLGDRWVLQPTLGWDRNPYPKANAGEE